MYSQKWEQYEDKWWHFLMNSYAKSTAVSFRIWRTTNGDFLPTTLARRNTGVGQLSRHSCHRHSCHKCFNMILSDVPSSDMMCLFLANPPRFNQKNSTILHRTTHHAALLESFSKVRPSHSHYGSKLATPFMIWWVVHVSTNHRRIHRNFDPDLIPTFRIIDHSSWFAFPRSSPRSTLLRTSGITVTVVKPMGFYLGNEGKNSSWSGWWSIVFAISCT
jgi:hypothetical protein